jgi:hypothetical protein
VPILPFVSAAILQPNECGGHIWRHMLAIGNLDDTSWSTEDFHRVEGIANCPLIETTLYAIVRMPRIQIIGDELLRLSASALIDDGAELGAR